MAYSLIDHKADLGIIVSGADEKRLFANTAGAMFDLITDTDRLKGRERRHLQISGCDWPDLMVAWLRELLYLWNGEQKLLKQVRIVSLNEKEIQAAVTLDSYSPDRHIIKQEIKAVTYHQIDVRKEADQWRAQIIFDV